jgi:hypothetical protein
MYHMGTRSFGLQWGALNWVDWHDGHWWMTFANYDLPCSIVSASKISNELVMGQSG